MRRSSVSICFLILLIKLPLKARSSGAANLRQTIFFCDQDSAQMSTLCFVLTQTLLLGREWRGWLWLHRAAKSSQHFCINLVGLGLDASRPRVLAHPHCLHQSDFYLTLL